MRGGIKAFKLFSEKSFFSAPYLISFVLNFKARPYCPKNINGIFYLSVLFSIAFYFFIQKRVLPDIILILGLLLSLFITCMFCQSQLNKNKPSDKRNLTAFYVIISSGGFIGGIFVSWIMPLISTFMIEYLLGFAIIFIALAIKEKPAEINTQELRLIIYNLIFIFIWPFTFKYSAVLAVVLLLIILFFIYKSFACSFAHIISLLTIVILSCVMNYIYKPNAQVFKQRNYYGIYEVFNENGIRFFLNGSTVHGAQYLNKENEMQPATYFHNKTPIGKVLASDLFDFRRLGIIGLGAGTLSAYGKPNQAIDFFELDPDVFKIANKYFSYLKKSPSKLTYRFGDARLSLLEIPDKYYDLLVVDAFSGDSVPVQLLTIEAIKGYLRCITDRGVVLFHITNRYANLLPLLSSNAKALNLYACADYNAPSQTNYVEYYSLWFSVTPNAATYELLISGLKWSSITAKDIKPWTDQYSNLFAVLKLNKLFSLTKRWAIQLFMPLFS